MMYKQQVDTIPSQIKASDYKDRMDIRDWPMVTIDGEDAKDLDDAITLSRKGKNYLLGVHIADVSEYVTEYSPLDKEALKTRNKCISCRPCDSDASTSIIEWNLFLKSGMRQTGIKLYHGS